MQNSQGGRGARPWTCAGPENRYQVLHWDCEGVMCQLVDSNNMNKGRYKRMRRSTGGVMVSPDNL